MSIAERPHEELSGKILFCVAAEKSVGSLSAYSFGRNAAAVFHLMRVLEIGLTALASALGISMARTNWNRAIEQVESAVRDTHKDPRWRAMADRKEQFAQCASHFGILKDAWRNYTAHARGKYDDQEAADIFVTVRAAPTVGLPIPEFSFEASRGYGQQTLFRALNGNWYLFYDLT